MPSAKWGKCQKITAHLPQSGCTLVTRMYTSPTPSFIRSPPAPRNLEILCEHEN